MSDSFCGQWPDMEECSIVFVCDESRKEAHVKTVSTAKVGDKTRKKGALDNFAEYGYYKRTCGETVHIPEVDKVNGYPVTRILNSAFSYCHELRLIYIPKTVKDIEWNNLGCESLVGIYVDAGNPCFMDIDGVLFTKDGKTIVAYPNGHGQSYAIPDGVDRINSFAFKGCCNLNELSIPDSVREIGDNAFYRCTSLLRIKLPDGVEKVGKYIDGEPKSEPRVIYRGQVYDSINGINL